MEPPEKATPAATVGAAQSLQPVKPAAVRSIGLGSAPPSESQMTPAPAGVGPPVRLRDTVVLILPVPLPTIVSGPGFEPQPTPNRSTEPYKTPRRILRAARLGVRPVVGGDPVHPKANNRSFVLAR